MGSSTPGGRVIVCQTSRLCGVDACPGKKVNSRFGTTPGNKSTVMEANIRSLTRSNHPRTRHTLPLPSRADKGMVDSSHRYKYGGPNISARKTAVTQSITCTLGRAQIHQTDRIEIVFNHVTSVYRLQEDTNH